MVGLRMLANTYRKMSSADYVFRVFNVSGQISFAYAGHAAALEIQASISSTSEKPSSVRMWEGALGAYFGNAVFYFPFAFAGYWAFGQDVNDNVLVALQLIIVQQNAWKKIELRSSIMQKRPAWLIAAANLMMVCSCHWQLSGKGNILIWFARYYIPCEVTKDDWMLLYVWDGTDAQAKVQDEWVWSKCGHMPFQRFPSPSNVTDESDIWGSRHFQIFGTRMACQNKSSPNFPFDVCSKGFFLSKCSHM